jgi:hypothetical protein
METMFSAGPSQGYMKRISARGGGCVSNTSTLVLRVVEGYGKGTQYLGV